MIYIIAIASQFHKLLWTCLKVSWPDRLIFFFFLFSPSYGWLGCVQEMDLSKGSAKKREWKYLKPSWWWLSWQKKHENVFNFIIISNGFAAQCIHLKTVFAHGRTSWLLIKQMFLGQHVGPVCQLVYQSAKFLSIQKTRLPCTSSSSGLFLVFLYFRIKGTYKVT